MSAPKPYVYEGPNGSPRPVREVSPNSRLAVTFAERVRGVKLPNLKRWACCGGFCEVSHTPSCPVLTRDEPHVLGMLLGIRRELDAWPATWEHRCYSREEDGVVMWPPCACGVWSMLDIDAAVFNLEMAFLALFDAHLTNTDWGRCYAARPGTTIEVRR